MQRNRQFHEIIIPFLQIVTDVIGIELAFLFSYWLRFHSSLTQLVPVTKGFPGLNIYICSSFAVIVVWLFIFKALQMYGLRRNVNKIDEFYQVIKAISLGMLIVTSVAFFYRGFSYSRLVFILIWVSGITIITLFRIILLQLELYWHKKGKGLLNVAIIGSSKWGDHIFENIRKNTNLGFKIMGYLGNNPFLANKTAQLGDFSQIRDIAQKKKVDVFFIALDKNENHQLFDLLNECTGLNVQFYLVPDLLEMMTSTLRLKEIEGIPVLKIKDVSMTAWQGIIKRTFDLLSSFILLILLLPLFIVISLAIKGTSKGRLFFIQQRIGMDGSQFNLIKFCTMIEDAEKKTGPVWAVKNDPRVTKIGRILRRFSLDELPQLWNVFKGDMSIVGPRPERAYFVEQFKNRVPKYLERHKVKSGMTGWAQVAGLRGNVPIEERTKYDVYYVENWSLLFDLKIILLTIRAVIMGENAV